VSQDPSLPKYEIPLSDGAKSTNKNWYFFFQGLLQSIGGGVTKIIAGTNVTISPTTGVGNVTVNASGGGGSGTVTSVDVTPGSANITSTGGPVTTAGAITVDLSATAKTDLALAATALQTAVTSVGFSDGSTSPIYTITGSPVTSTGTLTETLKTQTANTVFAGPASGAVAQPTFRALVQSDLPVGIPATIPDLVTWFSSDILVGSSGYPVTRIKEQVPWIGGPSFVNATGSATTQNIIDSATLNGLTLLKMSTGGASCGAVYPSSLLLCQNSVSGAAGATYFAVVKPVALVGTALNAIIGGNTGSLALYLNTTASTQKIGLVKTGTAVISTATNAWTIGTAFQCNATYLASTGAYAFRQARATNGSGTGTANAAGPIQFFGADSGGTGNFANGHSFAEIIAYDRVLSGTEIGVIEAYLLAKWGV
jgi:hypothetical protein